VQHTDAGERVDWDWEDGPPRDVPQDVSRGASQGEPRRPDDSRRPDDAQPPDDDQPADDSPSFADAIDRFEAPSQPADASRQPPYYDDERTQVIRASQRPEGDSAYEAGPAPDDRRPRSPADRAAARARRRKQIQRRRLIALGVLIAVVVLLVVVVVRGCGGPSEGQAVAPSPRVEYVDQWAAVDAPEPTNQADLRQDDRVHRAAEGGTKATEAATAAVAEDSNQPVFRDGQ
jgi:hypothetical protein